MPKLDVKKLLKQLDRNDKLVPHINMYQDKGEFPPVWNIQIHNVKAPDPYFHPSGDCFTDPVELYLQKTGQQERSSIGHPMRRVFDCGHFWHGYYQNILVDMGFVLPENVERPITVVRPQKWVGKGTIDLLDVDIPGHGKYLVDLKTMNDVEFDDGPSDRTWKKWEAQVNCYMDWTGRRDAFILAVRKGGTKQAGSRPQHDLKEYTVEYKPELLEEIYGRWEQAQRYIDGVDDVPVN